MSGSAAGDMLLVVSTRDVSWAVFMATSPPLGNIQWNLRFMRSFYGASLCRYRENHFPFLIFHFSFGEQLSFFSEIADCKRRQHDANVCLT
jgi:hypothetical protein